MGKSEDSSPVGLKPESYPCTPHFNSGHRMHKGGDEEPLLFHLAAVEDAAQEYEIKQGAKYYGCHYRFDHKVSP